jgi:hypothetical protein
MVVARAVPAEPVPAAVARVAEIARSPERSADAKSDTEPVSVASTRVVGAAVSVTVRVPAATPRPTVAVPVAVPRAISIGRIIVDSPLDQDLARRRCRRRTSCDVQRRGQALTSRQGRWRVLRVLGTHPRLRVWMTLGGLDGARFDECVRLRVPAVTYRWCWPLSAGAQDRSSQNCERSIHGRHRSTLRRA